MSRQRIRFVEARTARAIAIIGAIALLVAALALGIAIGTVFARSHLGEEQTLMSRRSYEIEELGRLNAALIQLAPRVDGLSAQVNELHEFDIHMKAANGAHGASGVHDVPPLPDSEESAAPLDGAGGPLLPPRLCDIDRDDSGTPRQRLKKTQRAIDCLNGEVSQLQTQTLDYYTAYMAFPGRNPAPGTRTGSPYGNRLDPFTGHLSFHPGQDFPGPSGTPILASAGGRVVQAGERAGYGNAVDIRHSDGMVTRYGHASRIFVKAGDYVMPGQEIAEIGSTGRSTGPHLHFEVIVDGAQLNPSPYLALFRRMPNAQS
ncbi:peptidase M23B [Caballeronia temeraria]|uniref:Peptidase M23B n=1 Tax=Caballeronia temeraria TaxID=1777137 RepID=A0A158BSE5_9BURK|nr:M23 family metallopeptidase [Caballeronia temeraria]SAK73018.1 peptidase M23B [Caballeronia temeraria]